MTSSWKGYEWIFPENTLRFLKIDKCLKSYIFYDISGRKRSINQPCFVKAKYKYRSHDQGHIPTQHPGHTYIRYWTGKFGLIRRFVLATAFQILKWWIQLLGGSSEEHDRNTSTWKQPQVSILSLLGGHGWIGSLVHRPNFHVVHLPGYHYRNITALRHLQLSILVFSSLPYGQKSKRKVPEANETTTICPISLISPLEVHTQYLRSSLIHHPAFYSILITKYLSIRFAYTRYAESSWFGWQLIGNQSYLNCPHGFSFANTSLGWRTMGYQDCRYPYTASTLQSNGWQRSWSYHGNDTSSSPWSSDSNNRSQPSCTLDFAH